MFADIRVALNVGVIDDGGVIPRWRLVDAISQRAETRNRVDRNHVLRAAFTEHTTDAGDHRRDPDPALAGDNGDDILPPNMPPDAVLQVTVVPFTRRFTRVYFMKCDDIDEFPPT